MTNDEMKDLYARALAKRMPASRDGCPSPEELRSVAEGAASSEERLDVMEHVSACLPCQRELALLGTVADAGSRSARTFPVRWLVLAASFVAVALGVRAFQARDSAAPVMRGAEPAVLLASPTGARLDADDVHLVWHAFPGATRYDVEVLDATGALVHSATVRDTVLTVPPDPRLTRDGSYRWHVTAIRADGRRVESPMGSFVIGSP